MSVKLFVGSLPFSTTDQSLRELFEQFGEVSDAKIIEDRETGRSRGFGFVEFASAEAANAAIEALDGSSFDGRTIVVNKAHEKTRR